MKVDEITQSRIDKLHPKIREEVRLIVNEANLLLGNNVQIRIVQGLRTFEEQDALYAQGRTKPGKKVTNARKGQSYHNYGLAVDFCLLINNNEISWDINKDFDNDNIPDWLEVRDVFKKYGYTWGGNFKTLKDYPHFEKVFGYSWKQLLTKYNNKDFIKNTKYLNLK